MTAVEHTEPYNTDYRVLCADGIYRWFNARGAPVLNRDGSVREWVGVCLKVAGRSRYGASTAGIAGVYMPPAAQVPVPSNGEELPTPGQIRAARGLTGMSKDDLAAASKVSVST